jgi:hypothetical protein
VASAVLSVSLHSCGVRLCGEIDLQSVKEEEPGSVAVDLAAGSA